MGEGIPGESSYQDKGREFDALWAASRKRFESHPGPSLEELKRMSSDFHRLTRVNQSEASIDWVGRNRQYDSLLSSKESGFALGVEHALTELFLVESQHFGAIGSGV